MSRFTRFHPYLPIFKAEVDEKIVLYTPGHLMVVTKHEAQHIEDNFIHGRQGGGNSKYTNLAEKLEALACKAVRKFQAKTITPYAPECLTIFLSNRCNLSCSYCFSTALTCSTIIPPLIIREEVVRAAARVVAQCCAEKEQEFYLVIHGGGEPTQHPGKIKHILSITQKITNEVGLKRFAYIATNGVLSVSTARWLAQQFDLIGLSCDGPPDIQDKQRPLVGSKKSSAFVERTAQLIVKEGGQFVARATITPQTVERQAEIVAYLYECLGATQIRFEPVFRVHGSGQIGFIPSQAEWFARHFLVAQQKAQMVGCQLTFSGSRLDEMHGPYCDVLRDTLHLNPDGTATACFFQTDSQQLDGNALVIGHLDKSTGKFVLNTGRIASLRHQVGSIPDRCRDCINAYHCTRECPEVCSAIVKAVNQEHQDNFRCLVQRQLAQTWILQAVESLMVNERRQHIPLRTTNTNNNAKIVVALLSKAPPSVDKDAILHQWEAVTRKFRIKRRLLPSPVWAQRGFEHNGAQAWKQLSCDFPGKGDERAMSIYIHVPFCDRRCGFCDCYSLPLGQRNWQKEEYYVQALLKEIYAWSQIQPLNRRPVTTIHFGGGTPNHLSPAVFERIIKQCRAYFGVTKQTEWALESTSSLLIDEHLEQLLQWGFTRLHVGVQTLEEPIRRLIGRRERAEVVMKKLARALEMGFIVSVDIIYGLPGQTLSGLVTTLEHLIGEGIHGFSLYNLQVSSRNRWFLERHNAVNRDALCDYILFQVAEQCLFRHGYRKNHFTHFARPEDTNLYFTHPQRGEDLLALGPTADGIFDSYHYRHPEYNDYITGADADTPILQGGVWESPLEQKLRPSTIALMAGSIPVAMLQELNVKSLLESWLECELLEEGQNREDLMLTANGSWFINDMLKRLSRMVASCM